MKRLSLICFAAAITVCLMLSVPTAGLAWTDFSQKVFQHNPMEPGYSQSRAGNQGLGSLHQGVHRALSGTAQPKPYTPVQRWERGWVSGVF
jgi:hypothetical protein